MNLCLNPMYRDFLGQVRRKLKIRKPEGRLTAAKFWKDDLWSEILDLISLRNISFYAANMTCVSTKI